MPQTHFPIKLTSSNFPVWRKQIQSTLIGLDLLQYIDGTLAIPSQFSDNERKTIMSQLHSLGNRQDQTLLSAIRGSCSDMIQPIISSASSSKEAWERLLHSYENASRSRIISLKSKLAKNPKGNKSVAEFLNENVLGDEFNSLVAVIKVRESPITYSDLFGQVTDFEGCESKDSGHTTGDCRKLAKFLRENNISFVINSHGASHHVTSNLSSLQTYADYGGPDEIFLGDGNSHPISHTGNTQMGIDWDTLIFYWHTHMYNPVKQCMINVQLFNAQVGVYQSKVRVSKSSPHTNLYTSHKSLALSNVLCVPNLRQNLISIAKLCKSILGSVDFFFLISVKDLRTGAPLLRGENIGDVYCVTFPRHPQINSTSNIFVVTRVLSIKVTSYHFISIDGSPLIDSQHPIPSQTTTQPSTYDSPIPSSTPQAPSSPQQPTDSPSLPPSVTLSPAPATFQKQTPDIFEEEHTPHTFQQHTPNTSDQQHTHSPPVTSQSPGPHATTSQPPQTQSNLQRPTHEKKRNPKCFNEKYVNTARNNTKFLDEFVNNLSIKFSIKDLGTSHQFLGVEVISTPSRSIVGSLQYLAITRPDVSFAVNKLSQFMHAPTQLHLQALKRELRYFKGTIYHGLFLNRKSAITLTAFSDSNWGGIKGNGRSTTAYILYLCSNIISWRSARQKSISRSSTEAEYKALANASAEMMWVQNLLHELGISFHETPTLFCDNTGATYLCANPVYHSCMKHVAHFVYEWVSEGSLRVLHISSKDQLVDMLTKPLGRS
ncbi:retrovirus-related pol polyprotein from transposon TNT 1-94 [Tanacetum coccineum]